MRQHLDRIHPLVVAMAGDTISLTPADVIQSQAAPSSSSGSNTQGSTISSQRDREDMLTSAICAFIARDMVPVSVVEGAGFKSLIQTLEPGYVIPDTQFLEDQLRARYMMGREKLKTLISNVTTVALSCYTWIGSVSQVLLTVVIHFIGEKHTVESYVLSTFALPEEPMERTPEDILQVLLDSTAEFELNENKIVAVVHDNSTGLKQAVNLFKQAVNCEAIPCMGVVLTECINMAFSFPDIDETINVARNMAAYFKPGTPAAVRLEKQAKEQYTDVQQDLTKHWTSIFNMCVSLADQQEYISSAVAALNEDDSIEDECPHLIDQQWQTVHAVAKVLMPLTGAVKVLAEEQFVSISSSRAILRSMEKKLEVEDNDPPAIRKLKETIHTEIKQRFQLQALQQFPLPSTIAAALDPRHKTLKYHTDEQKQQMHDSMAEIIEIQKQRLESQDPGEQQEKPKASPPAKRRKSGMTDLLGSDSEDSDDESQQQTNRVEEEIKTFAKEKVTSKESNPLEWWHENKSRYLTLASAANSYMCIPCTASMPRDAFTKNEITKMPMASTQSVEVVDYLMFLSCNDKLVLATSADNGDR